MKIIGSIFAAVLALIAVPALAQPVTANLPVTCNLAGTSCVTATPVTNPDGTTISGGGGTGPSASQLPATLGPKTGALSLSIVPNTDTAFPVSGTFWQATQPISAASLPLPTGAMPSSGGTVGISGTLPAFASTPTFNLGTLNGAATEATLAAASAKLPSSLGAKTGALSLSVVPNSDTAFTITDGSGVANSITVDNATAANFNAQVVGNVANAVADSGNGVKAAGVYSTSSGLASLTAGNRADLQSDIKGNLRTLVTGVPTAPGVTGTQYALTMSNASGAATAPTVTPLAVGNYFWDGTNTIPARVITGSDGTGLGIGGVAIAPQSNVNGAIIPCVSASAAETSKICKASAGNYYDGYCQSSAAGRCILYNATTVPGAGALTAALVLECVIVPAGGSGAWAYGDIPRRASTGMVILFSSGGDCNTYTASSTAYIHGSVM